MHIIGYRVCAVWGWALAAVVAVVVLMKIWPSTARSDEWPARVSTPRCWRALAKGTAWAGFVAFLFVPLAGESVRHLAPGREDDHKKVQFIIIVSGGRSVIIVFNKRINCKARSGAAGYTDGRGAGSRILAGGARAETT